MFEDEWRQQVQREDFPEMHRALCDAIGPEETVKLAERYGGQRYKVPALEKVRGLSPEKLPGAHGKVARMIGWKAYTALCEAFGGAAVKMPCAFRVKRSVRARMIRKAFQEGVMPREIARYYGVKCAFVFKITGAQPPE